MSDPYLLAASLLTGVPLPGSTLPQMTPLQPDGLPGSLLVAWDLGRLLQPLVREKVVPTIEAALPEFSRDEVQVKPAVDVPASVAPIKRQVVSGTQLYQQRLAALQAGQIYTRLAADSFEAAWVRANGKPTYQQWLDLLLNEARAIAQGQGENKLNILIGDSLSLWFPIQKLPGGKFWLNQGISGDTSGGIARRLSALAATRPDTIYVMAGINDLRRGANDDVILRNHRQITRLLRQNHPEAQIVVQSILPTRLAGIPNRRIRFLNGQLAAISRQEDAYFLDMHSLFADGDGNLRRELTTDGLHLSQAGYDVWHSALDRTEYRIAMNNRRLAMNNRIVAVENREQ